MMRSKSERELIKYPEAIKIIEDNDIGDLIVTHIGHPLYINNGHKYGVLMFIGDDNPFITISYEFNNKGEGIMLNFKE